MGYACGRVLTTHSHVLCGIFAHSRAIRVVPSARPRAKSRTKSAGLRVPNLIQLDASMDLGFKTRPTKPYFQHTIYRLSHFKEGSWTHGSQAPQFWTHGVSYQLGRDNTYYIVHCYKCNFLRICFMSVVQCLPLISMSYPNSKLLS